MEKKKINEEKVGQRWLQWEREQVTMGKRRTLPCDLWGNRTGHESRIQSNELNDDHIKILRILQNDGPQSSIKIGERLGKKSISVSLLMNKLINQNKVRKVGLTERSGPKKNGTAVWIYDIK